MFIKVLIILESYRHLMDTTFSKALVQK